MQNDKPNHTGASDSAAKETCPTDGQPLAAQSPVDKLRRHYKDTLGEYMLNLAYDHDARCSELQALVLLLEKRLCQLTSHQFTNGALAELGVTDAFGTCQPVFVPVDFVSDGRSRYLYADSHPAALKCVLKHWQQVRNALCPQVYTILSEEHPERTRPATHSLHNYILAGRFIQRLNQWLSPSDG